MEMAPRTLINVNFPALPAEQIKGVRVVRQGFHDYSRGSIVEGVDPRGYTYYWFGLHGIEQSLAPDSDLEEIDAGANAVTPRQRDMPHDAPSPGTRRAYTGCQKPSPLSGRGQRSMPRRANLELAGGK